MNNESLIEIMMREAARAVPWGIMILVLILFSGMWLWDRGKELTDHKRFTLATDTKVYFCDPSSPWQRGANENTNGLFASTSPREPTSRFIPKSTWM